MSVWTLQSRDLYLGTLFATEKQKVYGYVTNTRIKFILIVDSSNATSLRDNEIRQMFRKLHTVYTQLLSNPFYVPGNQGSDRMALILNGLVGLAVGISKQLLAISQNPNSPSKSCKNFPQIKSKRFDSLVHSLVQ